MSATLSGLSIESVTLEPSFDPFIPYYEGTYAADATSLSITFAKTSEDAVWGRSHADLMVGTVAKYLPGDETHIEAEAWNKSTGTSGNVESASYTKTINLVSTADNQTLMVRVDINISVTCDGVTNRYVIKLVREE